LQFYCFVGEQEIPNYIIVGYKLFVYYIFAYFCWGKKNWKTFLVLNWGVLYKWKEWKFENDDQTKKPLAMKYFIL